MSTMVKALRDRRANVWEQAKEVAERAAEENRALSAEEQGQWDSLNDEMDRLDKRIKSALDQDVRSKEADEQFNRIYGRGTTRGSWESSAQSDLRSFLRGDEGAPRSFIVQPTGPVDFRTLLKGTASLGGNTVPTSFYDRLVAHLIEVSGILQAGPTVLNTDSGETLQIPKTTGHTTISAVTAEASALSTSDPVFGQASLGAYKYGVMLQLSRELVTDTGVDLEGYIAMQAGRALGNAFGADAVTGNGSSKPTGILNNSTVGVTGATGQGGGLGATSPTANSGADLLFDLFYSVIAPYRNNRAAWIVKDSTMAILRKVKDTTGQYIFQPSLVLGAPDTMMGKPIYTDPFVPAVATGAKSIIFGDISQFYVRMAGGVRFERSDDFAFSTDLVSFRAVLRADSILVDQTGAVKHFLGGAS